MFQQKRFGLPSECSTKHFILLSAQRNFGFVGLRFVLYLPSSTVHHLRLQFLPSVTSVSSFSHIPLPFQNVNNINLLPRIRRQQDFLSLVKLSLLTEENLQRFGENDCLTDNFACTRHIATPDAIYSRVIDGRRMLFTGARDYKIVIWDLQKAAEERSLQSGLKFEIPNAHNGWIWSITSFDEHSFYSSSWDNNIKCWRYGETAVVSWKSLDICHTWILVYIPDGSMLQRSSSCAWISCSG